MYERKVAKAYGRGGLFSCGVMVVGAIVGIAMLAVILYLIRGGDVEPRSPRLALALATPLIFIAGIVTLAALAVAWRGRRLDRAFAPWKLEGRSAGPGIRTWHGEVGGRRLDAWLHKGPTLELYLGASPATRGVLHRGGPLIRAISRSVGSREPLRPPPLDLEDTSFYADDPEWMRKLLQQPEAESAVRALMTETSRTATAVFFAPDAVKYMRRFLPVSEIDADNLRLWLAELGKLADAVDAVGPSSDGARPTRMETWARTARDRYLKRILLAVGLVGAVAMLALFLFAWWNVGSP